MRRTYIALVAATAFALVAAAPADARRHPTPKTYPFPRAPQERPARKRDHLPRFWNDGSSCAVGCRAAGVAHRWPVKPFRRQHGLRAGLNELRESGFHVGVDIQARDGAGVYALQSGRASVLQASGSEERVQVGNFIYWHIHRHVSEGQTVRRGQLVGDIRPGEGHLHLSEIERGHYVNPLRPGGRALAPWRERRRPVLGRPEIVRDGRVFIRAFDPQSFVQHTTYVTPVLAPAALAWRLFDKRGRRIGGLHWALRGTQVLPDSEVSQVFARDSHEGGFFCFAQRRYCRPNWHYLLAGGLAPRLDAAAPEPGRYRLSVYAWDWAGNTSARDIRVSVPRMTGFAGRARARTSAPRRPAASDRG